MYVLRAYGIAHNSLGQFFLPRAFKTWKILCVEVVLQISLVGRSIPRNSPTTRYLSCFAFICFHLVRTISFSNISVIVILVFVFKPRAL